MVGDSSGRPRSFHSSPQRSSQTKLREQRKAHPTRPAPIQASDANTLADDLDRSRGFRSLPEESNCEGWLLNMHPTVQHDKKSGCDLAAVAYYFLQDHGGMFKATMTFEPYLLVAALDGTWDTVAKFLKTKYIGRISSIKLVKKKDLNTKNHLPSVYLTYLQTSFKNVDDLLVVRKDLLPLARKNSQKMDGLDALVHIFDGSSQTRIECDNHPPGGLCIDPEGRNVDPQDFIVDVREHDVSYYLRVAIDSDVRVGLWYQVNLSQGRVSLTRINDRVTRAEPVVMAYDIEVTKAPLKFPDPLSDSIMMISYVIDGQGYLITNRDVVSEDIDDFEYTPKPEYGGPFVVYNEPDEEAVIRRWFGHVQTARPTIMVTYNGDAFDFPFVEARAEEHGIDMHREIGFQKEGENQYRSHACIHMDCFEWVKRDSYLPQGSQGLKAVTEHKLGYRPTELDPELMTPYAHDHPQVLAQYSVSDAVSTYHLYMDYVHPFVFSLCNVIPLNPDEVLRKGTGTLCETLLMVEAYRGSIVMPNRHEERHGNTFEGHLLASETYVGGHVEALEAGVFRSDIATEFKISPSAMQKLIDDLDSTLEFNFVAESKMNLASLINYDEVKTQIRSSLESLRDNPTRFEKPLIYHLDVAAMYPNIMLSNRLQPDAIVDDITCAACTYNLPGKRCDRRMTWAWRGEYFSADRDEYQMIKRELELETLPGRRPTDPKRKFEELTDMEKTELIHHRLGAYSQTAHKKRTETKVLEKEAIVCQRENSFYIDTLRAFRDRRYDYKALHKTWKLKLDAAKGEGSVLDIENAKQKIVLYDSMQLAHKCILNSFYGYVMRKGARWYSMEMAGITCLTGASIIQKAREVIQEIGRPLELDTDGIWCMLPDSFPTSFTFETIEEKKISLSYPCSMLNYIVYGNFSNNQYHDHVDAETGTTTIRTENSIFFELDGPYKAMVLPASEKENKLLKKRYAVFNHDGSVAELKGFEIKRRGELQLIKTFQAQIFERFLLGSTTEECYAAAAVIANRWLDVLYTEASAMDEEELLSLIVENRSMSKTLAEYGSQKSNSITCANRLAEFLGDRMVKDKGLACKFIISAQPIGAPITERVVPVAIFSATEELKRGYLRKWLKNNTLVNLDVRSIVDWAHYTERLESNILKLLSIPAAMQNVPNPVPRVRYPGWLLRQISTSNDEDQQRKLTEFFPPSQERDVVDLEDLMQDPTTRSSAIRVATHNRRESPALVEPTAPVPILSGSFAAWIRDMSPRWKARRVARARANGGPAVYNIFLGVPVKVIQAWDIIQIRPTQTPGKYVMWTYVDSVIKPITLRIPRKFYVNLREEAREGTFIPAVYSARPIQRTLPRQRVSNHLYEILVSEGLFSGDLESHFEVLLRSPHVDGVYELEVPLLIRAVLQLGTRATIYDGVSTTFSKAGRDGFGLPELCGDSGCPPGSTYLDRGSKLSYILLFQFASPPRQIFGLFLPAGVLHVFIVGPSIRGAPLQLIEETYTCELEARAILHSVFDYPPTIQSHVTYHATEHSVFKSISKILGLVEAKSTILVLSSPKEQSRFEEMLPEITRFPTLLWPENPISRHTELYPWQPVAVKRLIGRYLSMNLWLYRIISEAELYGIPVGNIDGDEVILYADVEFARRLLSKDMIIWWSPTGSPDIGGEPSDSQTSHRLTNMSIYAPGCYPSLCVSFQVKNLVVNAITQASLVDAFGSSGEGENTALSLQSFSVLKEMVNSWLDRKERFIHLGIDHLWRWLSSPASCMYEPGLQQIVYGITHTLFLRLLTEFKRLGTSIVAADFNQILLQTVQSRNTPTGQANNLVTIIKSHALFREVHLKPDGYYDFLLYMDSANLGGVPCQDPDATERRPIVTIFGEWNIATFLPQVLQPRFNDVVKLFIVKLYQASGATSRAAELQQSTTNPAHVQLAVSKNPTSNSSIGDFISGLLTRRMQKDVKAIDELFASFGRSKALPDQMMFPLPLGWHSRMTDAPLEYTKFVCAVFGLATNLSGEVGVLKKNVLGNYGKKEFAEEAVFKNPCHPVILRTVGCRTCGTTKDLDFCRDPFLSPETLDGRTPDTRWACYECESQYDRKAIEMKFIQMIQDMETGFQLQELRCLGCKRIKADNMSLSCSCGGAWQHTISKVDGQRRIRTICDLAKLHGMPLLKDYAGQVMASW